MKMHENVVFVLQEKISNQRLCYIKSEVKINENHHIILLNANMNQ